MRWYSPVWMTGLLALGAASKPSEVTLDCPGTTTQRVMKTETGLRVACYTADLELDGPVLDFDARGVKRYEFVISGTNQVGPMRAWHPNGARCLEASLGDGRGPDDESGDRRPRLQGPVTEWYPDGQKRAEGAFKDGLPDGVARAWGPPGVLRRECTWANGKPNGSWKSFFPDGKPETQVTMLDGRPEGQVIQWWPNGRKRSESSVANEMPEGVRREWSEEGVLLSEVTYSDGIRNGPFRDFYPNGKPKNAATYAHDQVEGPFQQWHENGQLQSSGAFLAGERHGSWKAWHPNGQLARVESFDKGRELPGWATFFADGTPSGRLSKAGAFERFYPNGAPREKGTIGPKGRRQGKWIWFGRNGKPERTGSYQAGRLNGEVITMGQDGKPAQRDQFRNGLLVSPRCPPGVRMSRSEEQRQISCRDDKGQQHGPQYFFDEDGRYNVWTYEHGVLHGLYQNGWTELHYVHGVLQGPTVSWYRESDQKLREGQYDQDKETGLWTSWYEDGKVAQLGRYVEGKRDGVWELFRKDGSKWLVVTFANGEVKSSRGFDASGAEAAKADPLETVLEAMPRTVAERHFADMGEKATVARPEEAMGEEDGEDRVCRSVLAEAFRVVAREWLPQLLEVKPERAESGAAQPAGTERSAP